MIGAVVILLIVVLSYVLSHVDNVNESDYLVNRITDCFFIDNDIKTVELICDNFGENYPSDNCYSLLFRGAMQESHRWKVNSLKSGQCRSKSFNRSQFHKIADKFPNITDLNLAFLGAHEVSYFYSLDFYPHLKVLNMSHNKIGLESDANYFSRIHGILDAVDISFNHFNNWPITFSGDITSLNLSYNSITYLATLPLSNVRELRVLDLRNNEIAYLDQSIFQHLYQTLEAIHLQNNKFKQFVDYLYSPSVRSMIYLDLSGNEIENYKRIWLRDFDAKMQYLDLSHNNIKQILVNSASESGLKSLDVSHNGLQTFNYTYNGSMALNELILEGNDLHQLDTISPANFPNLTTISISKNRFDCEYAQRFVRQWNDIKVIGDLCDQKGNESDADSPILHIIIVLLGCSTVIASIWFVRSKILRGKKQGVVGPKIVECRSSDQYEEPLPYVEPIYHEIDYSITTSLPNSSHANKQYDHLTRDPLPLSPIQLHYDNLAKCNKPPMHVR